ncbi:MAG TPA: prolyl oligopeptidase family serine peptidase [Gemmatimonadales bacterium]|nr:prolyl oligopeptidase family serine peptidase [Gemmatimonadales bacterium]
MLAVLTLLPAGVKGQSRETGFLDRRVSVAGRAYRYQVFVPASYTATQRWPVILFLHGAGERGDDGLIQTQVGLGAALRQNAARFPAIIVFPQAPAESMWTGAPAQMAMAALDETSREFRTDSDRVYLTGLSLGGNGTWYLAYRYPSRFAAIVPVCGFVTAFRVWSGPFAPVVPADSGAPFEALARQLRRVPTWIVHGEVDNVVPVEQSRQAAAALKAAGAPVQYVEVPGTGHNSWDAGYGSPSLVSWLFAQHRSH